MGEKVNAENKESKKEEKVDLEQSKEKNPQTKSDNGSGDGKQEDSGLNLVRPKVSPSPVRNDKFIPLKKRGLESPVDLYKPGENDVKKAKLDNGTVSESISEPV